MCRVSLAETERFPEQAAQYFDVLFTQVHARLSAYLKTFGLSAAPVLRRRTGFSARSFTHDSRGRSSAWTSWLRPSTARPGRGTLTYKPIRTAVTDLIESLRKH